MRVISGRFLAWLMSLTALMRYFVIALLLHVAFLVVLGSIKIVAVVPNIVARFTGNPLPPQNDTLPDDPFAAYRDFDYDGPTLGGGGGLGGKGPGGVPTATKAGIMGTSAPSENPEVAEVIGVFSESTTAITRPVANPGGLGLSAMSGLGEVGTGGIKGPGGPWLGAGRIGPQRSVNLNKFGGSAKTERAVLAALRWLKTNQDKDGSWAGGSPAHSGLALLCFFGHGETSDSAEFGATIDKGLRFLVSTVKSDGSINGNMYHQGIIGIALAEAYTLTTSPLLKEPLQKAIEVILTAQKVPKQDPTDKGGWRYGPADQTADLSVSGWQVMALKSAKSAGLEISEQSLSNAADYVWNRYGGNGFAYTGRGNSGPAMTGVGTLCQFFLGNGKDKRLEKSIEYLATIKCEWDKANLYAWYYAALSIFQGQGQQWATWNKQFQKALVDNQSDDGHWELAKEAGENAHGPVYSTVLCTLMLEVYYRFLPMYQVDQAGRHAAVAAPASKPTVPTASNTGAARAEPE